MHQNNNRQFVANGPKILVDYREKSSGLPDALVDAGFETNIVKLSYCKKDLLKVDGIGKKKATLIDKVLE